MIMSKWIKIEKGCELPEPGTACLLWHPSWGVIYGGLLESGEWCGNYSGYLEPETMPVGDPTHWFPLPGPPDTQSGGEP